VRALSGAGFSEVVLTGIHIGVYGRDLGEGTLALADLVRDVSAIEGIRRIRLGSLDPQSITPAFIQALHGIRELCPHFHLSLQSGSASVLSRMDRRYTPDDFAGLVRSLREVFPDAGITTDIMTGFPGETESEHLESLSFCERMEFSRMHVFRYSRRPGTRAAAMPGQVSPDVSARRAGELSSLAEQLSTAFACRTDGKESEVLIEKVEADGTGEGYTPDYVHVFVRNLQPSAKGCIVPLRLTFAGGPTLEGHPLPDGRTDVSQNTAS
jgi:threonylcarbamoyladenosine tRNA methylthiotransferase MtaB